MLSAIDCSAKAVPTCACPGYTRNHRHVWLSSISVLIVLCGTLSLVGRPTGTSLRFVGLGLFTFFPRTLKTQTAASNLIHTLLDYPNFDFSEAISLSYRLN